MSQIPDELRREVTIHARPERVWSALTDPKMVVRWFPTVAAEIDLRPGGAMRFAWDDGADEAIVDEVDAPTRLAFRWRPAGTDRPYTTVTIALTEVDAGTRLVLTESGFAALPDEINEQSFAGNMKGWGGELEELRALLEAAA